MAAPSLPVGSTPGRTERWNWAGLSFSNHSWLCECVSTCAGVCKHNCNCWLYFKSIWKMQFVTTLIGSGCNLLQISCYNFYTISLTLHILFVSCAMLFMDDCFSFLTGQLPLKNDHLCQNKNVVWSYCSLYLVPRIPMNNVIYLVLEY